MELDMISFVSYDAENIVGEKLIEKIKEDKWFDETVILVNCSPWYSSRLTQLVNHKLSYLNGNDLFEVLNLEIPMPGMMQVWSPEDIEFRMFDKYLSDWVYKFVDEVPKYLFISAHPFVEKHFTKIKSVLRGNADYKFAMTHNQEFPADYVVETIPKENRLLFAWENIDNTNFKKPTKK